MKMTVSLSFIPNYSGDTILVNPNNYLMDNKGNLCYSKEDVFNIHKKFA